MGIGQDSSFYPSTDLELSRARNRIQYSDMLTRYIDEYDSLGVVSDHIRQGDYLLAYSDHTQHLNGFAFRRILHDLEVRPRDFYIVIAASLPTGRQSQDLGSGTRATGELFEQEGIHFLEVARRKDLNMFPKDQRRDVIDTTKRAIEILQESVNPGSDIGVGVFPETTTEGAVLRPKRGFGGQFRKVRNGIQEVTSSLLPDIVRSAERVGREVILLPFANNSTYRIVEPRTTNPHLRAKVEIAKHKLTKGKLKPTKLAEVRYGRPYTLTEMKRDGVNLDSNVEVNAFAMLRVAREKPVLERGYYR